MTAAYKHGAGAKEVDCKVRGKRFGLANDNNRVLKSTKVFKRISKPKNVTSLEPGDIFLSPTHAMLYAGGGKVVEAAHHDNGKRNSCRNDSIRHKKMSSDQRKAHNSDVYQQVAAEEDAARIRTIRKNRNEILK